MKQLIIFTLVAGTVVVPMAMAQKPKKASDASKAGADKAAALSEAQWQTWGPSPCMPLHPGRLPSYRRKSVTFTYEVHLLPADAPKDAKTVQPFYLAPAADNPVALYAGQELIIQLTYALTPAVTGASDEATLAKARKIVDSELPLITIDIGSSQGTAINPAPLRPSQGVSALSIEGHKGAISTLYACSYKQPLIGDTIPTLTVTALANGVHDPLQLVQTSLPQVHTLSYFNVATGILGSTIKDQAFNRVLVTPATASTVAQYKTVTQDGDPRVMPVLFFTAYLFRPIDAEVPFEKWDIIPQPSVGFSLSSPSSDFFFGGSSEFLKRNVQIVYGYHYGQTTHLISGQVDDPTSKDAPQTQKRFDNGFFAGLTFNIDFIKGLFGGK